MIVSHAARTGQHYFHAMADVTGQPSYRDNSDIPPQLGQQQGLDPKQAALCMGGRALAIQEGIGWMDACKILDHRKELTALQSDDGSAPVPWLDSRPLSTPPRPWSEEDWNRDQRRASNAGVEVAKPAWQAGAELGRDVVGEAAVAARDLLDRVYGRPTTSVEVSGFEPVRVQNVDPVAEADATREYLARIYAAHNNGN